MSRRINPLIWAIALQSLLIVATLWILVFRAPPEAVVFIPVSTPQAQPRALEQQALLASMARSGAAPAPDLIAVESLEYTPDTALHADSLQAFSSGAPLAGGLGGLGSGAFSPFAGGLGGPGSSLVPQGLSGDGNGEWLSGADAALSATTPVAFFGIEERAERYLILLDTSNSMFVRSRSGQRYVYNYGQIKDETERLVHSFNANTLFNIIVYEGGAWAWQQTLQAATAGVKDRAAGWVHGIGENPSLSIRDRRGEGPLLREGGGTRLDTALKLAFTHYDPQVIFIVTDGEINSIPGGRIPEEMLVAQIRQLQSAQTHPARIHVVHFQTAQMREVELQTMRAIARQGKGRFIQVVAAER